MRKDTNMRWWIFREVMLFAELLLLLPAVKAQTAPGRCLNEPPASQVVVSAPTSSSGVLNLSRANENPAASVPDYMLCAGCVPTAVGGCSLRTGIVAEGEVAAPLHAVVPCFSPAPASRQTVRRRPHDRRIHHGYEGWQRLVPTQTKIQYAGSIGVASAGFGWDYGRRGQWETDLMVGIIPSYNSDSPKLTLTVKGSYVPWSVAFNDRFSFEPFSCGLFLSTILSDKFWVREPQRYPKGYYTFSTRIRSHVFIGQRFTCQVNRGRMDRSLRSVTLYYELSTCDFYLISRITNRSLWVKDLLSLSFGLKFQMFDPSAENFGR